MSDDISSSSIPAEKHTEEELKEEPTQVSEVFEVIS
jgi:hypothetical protein